MDYKDKIPQDFRDVVALLREAKDDLTDKMAEDVKEWRAELAEAICAWVLNGPEPNWQHFRESLNEICDDDGSPRLFDA